MASRSRSTAQAGFTLIEVLVAMMILLVGVLGVVTLVDGANAVTSKTKAREGGTAIARSVIEVSRSIRYRDLTEAALEDALGTRPGLADSKPAVAGYTIRSRGIDYEMTLTVCSLDDDKDDLGARPPGVLFCSDSSGPPVTPRDRNPDDYKRVRIRLVWSTRATQHSVTQTSSIINPVGGLGNWDFRWDFLDSDGNVIYYDCKYFIQADGFDAEGRAGAPRVLSVTLNRREPFAPTGVAGGRNGSLDRVDVEWTPNPECDVVGYRLYRSSDPASLGIQVNCPDAAAPATGVTTKAWCVDETAPASGPLYYRVVAIDTLASGSLREGTQSAQVTVPASGGNSVPTAPTNVTSCLGGQTDCNGPDGDPAPSGQIVIRWDASTDSDGTVVKYHVYRDATAYTYRWDDL